MTTVNRARRLAILKVLVLLVGGLCAGVVQAASYSMQISFANLPGGATLSSLTGLFYGVEYSYRVYASNDYAEVWSDVDTFTPSRRHRQRPSCPSDGAEVESSGD